MNTVIAMPQANPKLTNATRMLALCDRDELKIVRVLNKIANITNGHMVIRRHIDVPDGAYHVTRDEELAPLTYRGFSYPDIELIRPPFERLKPRCQLPQAFVGRMKQVCKKIGKMKGTAIIDKSSIYMYQNTSVGLSYHFNITEKVAVDARYLEIALGEMLQYPSVCLLKEERTPHDDDGETPLILGNDWGSCALIMPMKGYFDE